MTFGLRTRRAHDRTFATSDVETVSKVWRWLVRSDRIVGARDVEWVLNVPVTDPNWRICLNRLTDEELLYCLQHATGVTKRRRLEAYARKRKLLPRQGGG